MAKTPASSMPVRRAASARRTASPTHHVPFVNATLSAAHIDAMAAALKGANGRCAEHCRTPRSTMVWALTRMREGEDPAALVALGARNGVDISALPALAARLL